MKHKIIFKALVGSHSHGTATAESDEDYAGVYVQCNEDILSYGYEEYIQVNKDEKYFEVKRFLDLLMVANPAALELLFTPEDCVIINSPEFKMIYDNRHIFLTKKCYNTFAGYAKTQIQKSKGTDKKMNWETQRVTRKTPLDFCYIHFKGKTIPLVKYLENCGLKQEKCGLVKLNHMDNTYAMYYDYHNTEKFKGIIGENSNELRLTSISKVFADMSEPLVLYYNKDGFTTHCKDWKSYQTWLSERNTNRYHTNVSHGQIYDSKNLSHCRRLIDVAIEIGKTGTFTVRRPNVDLLLQIKRGDTPLDQIIEGSVQDISGLKEIYDHSNLPDDVDKNIVKDMLLKIRLYVEPSKKIGVICNTIDDFNKWKLEQNHNSTNSRKGYYGHGNNQYYYIDINNVSSLHGLRLDDVVYLVTQTELENNKEFVAHLNAVIT